MAGIVNIVTVKQNLAAQLRGRHELVHAIKDAKERRLATTRRADQRRHGVGRHLKGHLLQHLVRSEPGRDTNGVKRSALNVHDVRRRRIGVRRDQRINFGSGSHMMPSESAVASSVRCHGNSLGTSDFAAGATGETSRN